MKRDAQSQIGMHLVRMLKDGKDRYHSGEQLALELGVSRAAVWKHMRELQEAGYEIEAVPHLGYRLTASPDLLLPEEIGYHLKAKIFGSRILSFNSVDSTNRLAMELAEKGAPEGTIIAAENQTAGRGRLGRSWSSPRGAGLCVSVILRPQLSPRDVPRLTLTASAAVAGSLRNHYGIPAELRWPNDVLVGGKKVCGILTEISAEADAVRFVVVGLGVNVNGKGADYSAGATSVEKESGAVQNRPALLARILERLEVLYGKFRHYEWDSLKDEWNGLSAVRGKNIQVRTINEKREGEACAIEEDGALLLKDARGKYHRFYSGDVTLLR